MAIGKPCRTCGQPTDSYPRMCEACRQVQEDKADVACKYVPSESEIAAATAALRESWTEAEHFKRAGYRSLPVVETEVMPSRVFTG